jgi:hypothetical protein
MLPFFKNLIDNLLLLAKLVFEGQLCLFFPVALEHLLYNTDKGTEDDKKPEFRDDVRYGQTVTFALVCHRQHNCATAV